MVQKDEKVWEENGRAIRALFKDMGGSKPFEIRRTKKGCVLCVRKGEIQIPIMQLWPTPMDRLETRMQYVEEKIVLTDEMRLGWGSSLKDHARFKPTSGTKGNMKLIFGRQVDRRMTGDDLVALTRILRGIAQDILAAECN